MHNNFQFCLRTRGAHSEHIEASKMELFVEIVNLFLASFTMLYP